MDGSGAPTLAEALAMLDEAIATARTDIAALKAELDELELERQGVEAALKRFEKQRAPAHQPEPQPSVEASSSDQQSAGQTGGSETPGLTSTVLDLLRASDQPVSVASIVDATDLDGTQVRSALGYLRRKGDAHRVDRGLWQAGPPPDTETAPAGAETVSDTPHTHMKGGGADSTVSDGVRDLDSLRKAFNRDHRHGAPVVEASG